VSFIGWSERPDVRDVVPDLEDAGGLDVLLEDGVRAKEGAEVEGFGIAAVASALRPYDAVNSDRRAGAVWSSLIFSL
jgi:hypothetical protein